MSTTITATPIRSWPQESLAGTVTTNGLTLSTKWLNPNVVRITATRELDASNADDLAGYVFRRSVNSRRLILDLQDVGFFGTQGFSVLCTISERCAHASVNWTLVSSRAVSRVLEICDPDRTLPVAKS